MGQRYREDVESEEVAILRLLSNVQYETDTYRLGTVGVFCVEGPLRIGDILNSADDVPGVRHSLRAEVIEIQFFHRIIDSLDPVYSANVVFSGELGAICEGWTVHATRPDRRMTTAVRVPPITGKASNNCANNFSAVSCCSSESWPVAARSRRANQCGTL